MDIVVITPPPVEPVTVLQAYFQLKITADPTFVPSSTDPEYADVVRQITSAREDCEAATRRAFVRQTIRLIRGPAKRGERAMPTAFSDGCWGPTWPWPVIELKRPPLISLSAVRYYDDSNTLQEIDPTNYFVEAGFVPRLAFVDGFDAPSLYVREDAIQVEYVAGYPVVPGDPDADPPVAEDLVANVPRSIQSAILLGVQLQSDRLTPQERTAIENAQAALLSPLKVNSF